MSNWLWLHRCDWFAATNPNVMASFSVFGAKGQVYWGELPALVSRGPSGRAPIGTLRVAYRTSSYTAERSGLCHQRTLLPRGEGLCCLPSSFRAAGFQTDPTTGMSFGGLSIPVRFPKYSQADTWHSTGRIS